MDDFQQLLRDDIERFLEDHAKHGFNSKQDMIDEGIRCLRERLRIAETFVIGEETNEKKE